MYLIKFLIEVYMTVQGESTVSLECSV